MIEKRSIVLTVISSNSHCNIECPGRGEESSCKYFNTKLVLDTRVSGVPQYLRDVECRIAEQSYGRDTHLGMLNSFWIWYHTNFDIISGTDDRLLIWRRVVKTLSGVAAEALVEADNQILEELGADADNEHRSWIERCADLERLSIELCEIKLVFDS